MPTKPKTFRPAGQPTKAQSRRQYDKAMIAERSFYWSTEWRKFRAWFLGKYPTCWFCKSGATRLITEATQVDHIIPRVDRPDLAFEESNCRAACASCHAKYGSKRNKASGGAL